MSLPLPRDTPEEEIERRGEDSLSEMVKEGALGRRKIGYKSRGEDSLSDMIKGGAHERR